MKSVVFCSSQRFKKDLDGFMSELKKEAQKRGVHVNIMHPEFGNQHDHLATLHEKDRLNDSSYRAGIAGVVYDHLFRKVRVADVCFIFNKNGYLGANTNGELFAAAVLGKTVYSLENETLMGNYPEELYDEPSPRKLIHEVVSTPEELLNRLA